MPVEQVKILKINSDDGYPKGRYTWIGIARVPNGNSQSDRQTEDIKIVYDDNTKTIVVLDTSRRFSDVVAESHKYFPSDATLIIPCGLQTKDMESAKEFQKLGFELAIRSSHPLGIKLEGARLWGSRPNNLSKSDDQDAWLTDTDHYCETIVRLSEDTVRKLWKLVSEPIRIEGNDGNKDTESLPIEVGGRLDATETNTGHYKLTLNEDSIVSGDHTEVSVVEGIYNFHTHPLGIYKLYGLSIGIPSNQDYVGFLAAVHEYNTVMHLVLAKEGIYYISLAPGFIPFIGVMDDKFADRILREFPKCLKKDGTRGKQIHSEIESYLKQINSFECLGINVFVLTFKPWSLATTERVVFVPKAPSGECIFTQEELEKHREIFGTDLTELFGNEDIEDMGEVLSGLERLDKHRDLYGNNDNEGRSKILSSLRDRKKMLEYMMS